MPPKAVTDRSGFGRRLTDFLLGDPTPPPKKGRGSEANAAGSRGSTAGGPPGIRSQFPPHDTGCELIDVEELLGQNDDLLNRIRLSYGCNDETYQKFFVDVVRRYAGFVQLLPATSDNFFHERGGMLRMGLEIAHFSLQGTDNQIYGGQLTISQREVVVPRWRYSAFLAGLLSEVHRVFNQMVVVDEHGKTWPPYLYPLTQWCEQRDIDRYYVRWKQNARETRASALYAMSHIIPADVMDWLSDESSAIVPQMMASIGGLPAHQEANPLDQLVRRCVAIIINTNLTSSADRYGRPIQGAHLERYLIDGMRRLVANGTWEVNTEKARLWYGIDGLFLVWPGGATDLVRLLTERDELPGIPKSAETIAEILFSVGVIDQSSGKAYTWQIAPPGASVPLSAVRFKSPTMLLSAAPEVVVPIDDEIMRSVVAAPAATVAPTIKSPNLNPGQPTAATNVAPAAPAVASVAPSTAGSAGPNGGLPSAGPLPSDQPHFALRGVFGMNPPVSAALAQIVDTLNQKSGEALCRSVRTGLFIPITSFEKCGLDAAVAIRALVDAGMALMSKAGAPTHTEDFNRRDAIGVIVKIRFIAGFNEGDFLSEPDASGRAA